jgi:tRNA-specific 2-thiouridylase
MNYARKLGFDLLATGHYARVEHGEHESKMLRGLDDNKDQTYFLSQVSKEQLKNVLFPIGELTKPEVRKIAEELDLITAKKKDSTGICFIGERNFRSFLKNYLPNIPGDIVDIETNEVLGKHIGLMYYTLGQRKGLDLGGTKEKHYVAEKDLEKNILYVASGDENKYLYTTSAIIENFNFLTEDRLSECTCKFRYRQKDVECKVEYLKDNNIKLTYNGVKAVTPGQFCVLYNNDICLGGGIIKETFK